jgi:hypothetical protein|tara:strand:- start:69 stop:443 length:375 start_codon:yes stop_codon:yes gene_type:complete
MPRQRLIKDRCAQVLEWMKDVRPCGREVKLSFVTCNSKEEKDLYGYVTRSGRSLRISINTKKCNRMDVTIDTLIHEYAHCRMWGLAKSECSGKIDDHGPEFWAEYGVIYNLFHYEDGYLESNSY